MRKLIPILAAVFLLLAFMTTVGTWKWRTHGGVYGTRGIAKVAYDRIVGDSGVPQYIRDNLNWEVIRPGSIAPDTWRMGPYYVDSKHVMTYVENQGGVWLLKADGLRTVWATQDVSDNLSYYLGIAAHYWADVTQYAHHDNARSYYENLYGSDIGYQVWDSLHDHLEGQAEHYRPKDPALIVLSAGVPMSEYHYVTAEPDLLIDGSSKIGVITGGSYANTQNSSPDSSYEIIAEANTASVSYQYVQSETVYEGGTLNFANAQADDGNYENIYEINYGGAGLTTYDFSSGAGTNKWAYQGLGGNDAPPADNTSGTEITDYTTISTADDVHLQNTDPGTVTKNPFHRFKFTISESPASITQIDYYWEGCGSTDVTPNNSLYIWENVAGTWEWSLLGSNSAEYPDDDIVSGSITTGISNYIAAGGYLQLCVAGIEHKQDYVYTDYVRVTVTAAPAYRENVQHNITGIPSAPSHELQIRYYIAGDSEPVSVYLQNFSTSGWDNTGNIQEGTAEEPNLFTYNLTGTNYIDTTNGIVRVRFVQPDNDSAQTRLMVDYTRVAYGSADYRLNWEHDITGITLGRDNYTMQIYGRNNTGDENVGVYIWNFSGAGSWEFIDNLPLSDNWVTRFINGPNIGTYVSGGTMRVRYSQNTADSTRTTIYLDTVTVQAQYVSSAWSPYPNLSSFLADARAQLYTFINNVMPPGNPIGGWLGAWIRSRKCESSDYSEYAGNPGANMHYGTKELVDMATELVYSGWVYSLGIGGNVSADSITWAQWWSREHREPGRVYY